MFLTAGVTEGAQYKISEIKVSGDTILPQEDVERMVIQKPGDTFSRALLEFSSDTITNSLSNIGYAFAKVNPIPTTNRAEQTVGINMQVVPGPRVSVRRILFRGNTRTSDEVMRREMRQFENSWYSQAAIDRSKIRLQRLATSSRWTSRPRPSAAATTRSTSSTTSRKPPPAASCSARAIRSPTA